MLVLAIVGALGLAIGSFLNVVVYRVPAGKSLLSPPSACPNCGAGIRKYDNIPVLSWLLLRGKCRDCGEPISARYPLVELATAVIFVGIALTRLASLDSATVATQLFAALFSLAALLYLAAVSIALSIIDLETQRLPDAIVLPAYPVAAVLLTASALLSVDVGRLALAAIGMVALFLFYVVMAFGYRGGMGMGDVKLAGLLGMYLGYAGLGPLLVGAFAPFLLGGIFAIVLIVVRRAGRKSRIPFGPWMLLGSWLGILGGQAIFMVYLEAVGLG